MLNNTMPQVIAGYPVALPQEPSHFSQARLSGLESAIGNSLWSDRQPHSASSHSERQEDARAAILEPRVAPPVLAADADDLPSGAIELGSLKTPQTLTGEVNLNDQSDFYHFTFEQSSNFNLSLSGLTADADVRLFGDVNSNGAIDAGEEIQRSQQGLNNPEAMNIADLAVGSYFIQVYRYSGNTSYTLNLSPNRLSDILPTEFNLGTLMGTQSVSGIITNKNTTDVYRFSLTDNSALNISLTGLAADADVRLIRDANNNGLVDAGEELARSQRASSIDEAINWASLSNGDYFIQVYQYNGETAYQLNLSTTTLSNLLSAEVDLGPLSTAQTHLGNLNSTNTVDTFRFTLNQASILNLNLSGLSNNADVRLIQDLNNNQILDSSEIVAASSNWGAAPEILNQNLQAGTYFIQVYQSLGDTNYNLTLWASPTAPPTDNAGNTLATARDLGILSSPQTMLDYVGALDPNDFYRFTLNGANSVTLNLSGLSADADMQLIQDRNNNGIVDAGEVLAYPWQDGNLPETLTTGLEAGTYYIRIFPYSGSTTYSLTASASPISLPSGYSSNFGYGLVDAAAAVAQAVNQSPFVSVPDLAGLNPSLNQIHVPDVWANSYTGQGVVVAVVDSGVDYTHPDLDENLWVNSDEIAGNGIDDDSNGFIDDVRGWDFVQNDNTPTDLDGHGTHVAGTIAAENNGFGATGVAPNARIMPVRVLDESGSGTWASVAAGVRYAADNGAQVINLSLGGGATAPVVTSAIQYAVSRGAIVVIASGNEAANQPGFPANLANQAGVIAVGAVNSANQLANFSNDAGMFPLNYVVAPGVNIYSTTPGNTYRVFNGTSMATPHVAGVAALMLSANPTLTPAQITQILTQTARGGVVTA